MASPSRTRSSPRINLVAVPEVLTVDDQTDRMALGARSIAIRAIELIDLVWRREPTLFIELGVSWTIAAWAATILLFGISTYPPPISTSIGRLPETLLGLTGTAIVATQLIAIVTRHRDTRGYASFAAAVWLGYLSFSILAGNWRLAGGFVYLGAALAALLPFWRVVLDRRL